MKFPREIKKEPASLLRKSLDSLALAIEIFNRPAEVGRRDTVLILFDHSFEMLLKAGILHKGAKIWDKNARTPSVSQRASDGPIAIRNANS